MSDCGPHYLVHSCQLANRCPPEGHIERQLRKEELDESEEAMLRLEYGLGEAMEVGAQQAKGWLVVSSFGKKLNPKVSQEVLLAERWYRLAVDVEGGAHITNSFFTVPEESDYERLGVVWVLRRIGKET